MTQIATDMLEKGNAGIAAYPKAQQLVRANIFLVNRYQYDIFGQVLVLK